ncbi:DUF1513 domain-containing protein [Mesorhizobium sp. BAC0120]|uniref:DUF1513 domain-containing protein n=1 Tax=Mesorhizobium sp. BAC0120 TaxID=3090670 RepID=UPI00298CE570|nr:DUF1513 domain-containing protein [Mesorhizobium sp. BAC0120]MDW6025547.1 DUF1513 domain-containing protein [Mesorhizobium sp. BAC0120]
MKLIDRRDFMKAAGLAFAASLAPRRLYAIEQADAVFATAYQKKNGAYGVAVLSEDRRILFTTDLPDRGHDVTFDPIARRSVVFARRPGTFAVVFDHTGKTEPLTIASQPGRHFFGHGAFSPDGKLLYATENDYENAAGMIGVYDAADGFRRVGEFPTHGMDPHEVLLLADGRTLAVANGGVETHPDYGRAELNITTMQPSLVFLDRETGDLREKHRLAPELHQLSLHHLAEDASGAVWFGGQHKGPASERPPLVGKARLGAAVELLQMEPEILNSLRNYIGAVEANRDAGMIGVSSPAGNSVAVIDAASGEVVLSTGLVEVCGLAPERCGFVASTGRGDVVDSYGKPTHFDDYAWDNHLLRIG